MVGMRCGKTAAVENATTALWSENAGRTLLVKHGDSRARERHQLIGYQVDEHVIVP